MKRWVKLTNGLEALSINGTFLSTIDEKNSVIEIMGTKEFRLQPGPLSLSREFAEKKVAEIAVDIIKEGLNV